jgi:hypothetical protein
MFGVGREIVFITDRKGGCSAKSSVALFQEERNGMLKGVSLGVSFCSYSSLNGYTRLHRVTHRL